MYPCLISHVVFLIPTAAKRVLRYLKKTKNLKLEYRQPETGKKLKGFEDSDWANEKDRKSVGEYIFTLGEAVVSLASKKHTLVALSTEEPEYTAFSEGSTEKRYGLNNSYMPDIKPVNPGSTVTTIYADNQSALKHVQTERITARTKHGYSIRETTKTREPSPLNTLDWRTTRRTYSRRLYHCQPTKNIWNAWAWEGTARRREDTGRLRSGNGGATGFLQEVLPMNLTHRKRRKGGGC